MSESIERYRKLRASEDENEDEDKDDVDDLFDGGEGGQELTPEQVAKAWGALSDLEKKFVTTNDEQFEAIIGEYEKKHGEKKAGVIRALRKLILSQDPRAALIQAEINL